MKDVTLEVQSKETATLAHGDLHLAENPPLVERNQQSVTVTSVKGNLELSHKPASQQ